MCGQKQYRKAEENDTSKGTWELSNNRMEANGLPNTEARWTLYRKCSGTQESTEELVNGIRKTIPDTNEKQQ